MDACTLFLADHARIHSAAVAPAEGVNLEDLVCRGLTDDQLRQRLHGHTSIAWLLWHMARCEDVAINTMLRGVPEVLDDEGWRDKLTIRVRDVGTGMSDDEVEAFSAHVDLATLRAYRAAVGRATRAWVADLDFDSLDAVVDTAARRAQSSGAIGERAGWVGAFWEGKTRGWFLAWLGVGHNSFHLGEAEHVARMLGRPGR